MTRSNLVRCATQNEEIQLNSATSILVYGVARFTSYYPTPQPIHNADPLHILNSFSPSSFFFFF